mmetsp:Transcript_17105/g.47442  ORF Transcript_17105/g.47442 Transcript_17105/m.47442 type:complete len:208 (-) Transcript_17105:1149-1772(-)
MHALTHTHNTHTAVEIEHGPAAHSSVPGTAGWLAACSLRMEPLCNKQVCASYPSAVVHTQPTAASEGTTHTRPWPRPTQNHSHQICGHDLGSCGVQLSDHGHLNCDQAVSPRVPARAAAAVAAAAAAAYVLSEACIVLHCHAWSCPNYPVRSSRSCAPSVLCKLTTIRCSRCLSCLKLTSVPPHGMGRQALWLSLPCNWICNKGRAF